MPIFALEKENVSRVWWLNPVIPAPQEAATRRFSARTGTGQKCELHLKNN
jgi:hypothetical protein